MRRWWEWRRVEGPKSGFWRLLHRRRRSSAAMAKGAVPSSVQALYDICKKAFVASGAVASSQDISRLCSHLDTIVPSDVGLSEEFSEDDRGHGFFGQNLFNPSSRAARWAQPITYLHIHECERFTIGIFCMPTSSVIPLHDHPGMTVLSKILYGSMHVKAYDWVSSSNMQSGNRHPLPVRLAKLQVDTILTAPCSTTVLYPNSGGNLHCFTAITPCAILDVLAPPYSEAFGRKCTYYHDYPYSSFSAAAASRLTINEVEEDYAWLQEIEPPDDLYIRSGRYNGPTVRT